jgi:hypothetical protein
LQDPPPRMQNPLEHEGFSGEIPYERNGESFAANREEMTA